MNRAGARRWLEVNFRVWGHKHPDGNRAWLHLGNAEFGLEWYFFRRACRLCLDLNDGGDPTILLSVAVPFLFCFYFSFTHRWLRKVLPAEWRGGPGDRWRCPVERTLGIAVHDGTIWFHVWANRNEWNRSDPWYRTTHSFNPADFFLGRSRYSTRMISKNDVVVPMFEGNYAGSVEIFESTWKRPRWPWPRRIVRATVEVGQGVPVPGKGENSWDLDEDAIFSLTCPARTVPEAIAAMVESVLHDRERRSGDVNWRPGDG